MNQQMRNEIQNRAYEIYVESGKVPGNELENWQKAEREVMARQQPKSAAQNVAAKKKNHSHAEEMVAL